MMRATLVLIASLSSLALACSDPECGPNEVKIGKTCISTVHDSGQPSGDTRDGDASVVARDAAVTRDGSTEPSSNTTHDASAVGDDASVVIGDDASMSMMPTMMAEPKCGDGIVNGTELCDSQIAAGQTGACPGAASCTSSNACLMAKLTGAASSCDAACATEALTACKGGDGCCPTGCNSGNDNDCSASCGNGVVDKSAGETCEPSVGAGCPSSCPASAQCKAYTLTGGSANCNAACVESTISTASGSTKDGCCPAGSNINANNDADCTPSCGNGVVEAGEGCDGNCVTSCDDGDPCTSDALTGAAASCNAKCTHNAIASNLLAKDGLCCPAGASFAQDLDCPGCGDGVVQTSEQCDYSVTTNTSPCGLDCKWLDDKTTPGDDRPGYVYCGTTTAVSCGPGQQCAFVYPSMYTCVPASSSLAGQDSRYACDGPEDCPATVCGVEDDGSRYCLGEGTPLFCHKPSDCSTGSTCTGTGSTVLGNCKQL